MKSLRKIAETEAALPDLSKDSFGEPVKVQGAAVRAVNNVRYVESGGRFKLFAEGAHTVKFTEGAGFFKWARGEAAFSAGDIFRAENVGEYEINGVCKFFVVME